jgi:hypothetical protein
MKFNKLLALVGACATFGLVACGDDSSSGSDSSKTELSIVNLDETTKTVTFYAENKGEYCVLDKATKSASWKTIDKGNDTTTMKWDFVTLSDKNVAYLRDSLKYSIKDNIALNLKIALDGEAYSVGLYVGEDSSSVKGTWVSIPCSIDEYEGGVDCYERDYWKKVTLKVTSSSITADEEYVEDDDFDYDYDYDYDYDDDDYYTDDVNKSRFMMSLYEFLSGSTYSYIKSGYTAVETYRGDVSASATADYDVKINSQSKSSTKFEIKGKSYELEVNSFGVNEYDNLAIDLTLTSGDKTCSYTELQGYFDYDDEIYDKSACREDLYAYYETRTVRDYTGQEYEYAKSYEKDDSEVFEDCVFAMAGLSKTYYDEDPYDYDMYFKKPAKKKSDAEFWREYKHNMNKVLKMFK